MSEFVEFEGKFYRVCTVKYNGIKVDGALIPEDSYRDLKKEKKINSLKNKKLGFNSAKTKLWPIFSEFIRKRDDYICVTCGAIGELSSKYKGYGAKIIQAGHYFPKSAYSGIYYDERNVHAQCAYCNMNMEDPKVKDAYTKFMIENYGVEAIEILKIEGKQKNLSTSELELLKIHYSNKIKQFDRY
ncbi:MAG TPA: recombination protein NinG [Candidatus Pacearchaeota archaeon]|nr:recombination protein NinG [Candidatus Pacearchaeota archaeon]